MSAVAESEDLAATAAGLFGLNDQPRRRKTLLQRPNRQRLQQRGWFVLCSCSCK